MAYPLIPNETSQTKGFDLFGKIVNPEELALVKKDKAFNEQMYLTLAGEGKYPFSSYDKFQRETLDPEVYKKNKEEELVRNVEERKKLKTEYENNQRLMPHGDYYNTPEGQKLRQRQIELENAEEDYEKFKIEHSEQYDPLVKEFESLDKDPTNYTENVKKFKEKLESLYGKNSNLAFEKIAINHVESVEKNQRGLNADGTYKNSLYKNTSSEITQESALTQQKYLKRAYNETENFLRSDAGKALVTRRVNDQVGDLVKQYRTNFAKLTPEQKFSFEQAYNETVQDEFAAAHKEKYAQLMDESSKIVPEEVKNYVSKSLKAISDNAKNTTYEERQKAINLIENTAISQIKDPEVRKKIYTDQESINNFKSDLRFYMHNNTDYFLSENGWNPDIIKNNTKYYQDVIVKAQTPSKQELESHYEAKQELDGMIGEQGIPYSNLSNSKGTLEVLTEMLNSPNESWKNFLVDTSKGTDLKKNPIFVTQPDLKDKYNATDIANKIKYNESLSFGENALAQIWGIKKPKEFEWTDEKQQELDSLSKKSLYAEYLPNLISYQQEIIQANASDPEFVEKANKELEKLMIDKAVADNAKKRYDELQSQRNRGIYEYDRLNRIAESNQPESSKFDVINRTLTSFAHSLGYVLQGVAQQNLAVDNTLKKIGFGSDDKQRENLQAWSQFSSEFAKDIPIPRSKTEGFISGIAPFVGLAIATTVSKNPTVAYSSSAAFGYMGVGEAEEAIKDYEDQEGITLTEGQQLGAKAMYALAYTLPMAEYLTKLIPKGVIAKSTAMLFKSNPKLFIQAGEEMVAAYLKTYPKALPVLKQALNYGVKTAGKVGHSVVTMEAINATKQLANHYLIGNKHDFDYYMNSAKESLESGVAFGLLVAPFAIASANNADRQRRNAQGSVYLAQDKDGNTVEVIHEGKESYGLTPKGEKVKLTPEQIENQVVVPINVFNDNVKFFRENGTPNPNINREVVSESIKEKLKEVSSEDGTIYFTKDKNDNMFLVRGFDKSKGEYSLYTKTFGEVKVSEKKFEENMTEIQKVEAESLYRNFMNEYDKKSGTTEPVVDRPKIEDKKTKPADVKSEKQVKPEKEKESTVNIEEFKDLGLLEKDKKGEFIPMSVERAQSKLKEVLSSKDKISETGRTEEDILQLETLTKQEDALKRFIDSEKPSPVESKVKPKETKVKPKKAEVKEEIVIGESRKKAINRFAQNASRSEKNVRDLKEELTTNYGKNFTNKIAEQIDKIIPEAIDTKFVLEQRKLDKQFNDFAKTNEDIASKDFGLSSKITSSQLTALEMLEKTAILPKTGMRDIDIHDANNLIFEGVTKIQYLKQNKDNDIQKLSELQSRLFALMASEKTNAYNKETLDFLNNAHTFTEDQLNEKKQNIQSEIDKNVKALVNKEKYNLKPRQIESKKKFIDDSQQLIEVIDEEIANKQVKTKRKKEEKPVKEIKPKKEKQKVEEETDIKELLAERGTNNKVKPIEDIVASIEELENSKLYAEKSPSDNKYSELFPNIRVDNIKSFLGVIKKALLESGQHSFEKAAMEAIRLSRQAAKEDPKYNMDKAAIEDLFYKLFSFKYEPKNEFQLKVANAVNDLVNNSIPKIKAALEEHQHNTSVLTTGEERMEEQRKNLSPLFNTMRDESGLQKNYLEREFHSRVRNGKYALKDAEDYLKFLDKLENSTDDFDDYLLTGLYENNINWDTFLSYVNFYKTVDLYRFESIKIFVNGKDANKYEKTFLNPEIDLDSLVKTFMSKINNYRIDFANGTHYEKEKALSTKIGQYINEHNKYVREYDHENPNKSSIFEHDIQFLEDITGISKEVWRDHYFYDNEKKENETLLRVVDKQGNEKYVKTVFNSFKDIIDFNHYQANENLKDISSLGIRKIGVDMSEYEFVDSKPYYAPEKTSLSSKMMGSFVGKYNTQVVKDKKTNKEFIFDFMTKGVKGVYANIVKLSTSKKGGLGMMVKDLDGKQFSSFVQDYPALKSLKKSFDNQEHPFMQKLKKLGSTPTIMYQQGIKGYDFTQGEKKDNSIENQHISPEDLWISQMIHFREGDKTYFASAGQFSDRKMLLHVNSPKLSKSKSPAASQKWLEKNLPDYDNVVQTFISEYGDRIKDTFNLDQDGLKVFVEDFVYNFTRNTKDLMEIIHGDLKQYDGGLIQILKRGATRTSTGLGTIPVSNIHREFNVVVVKDLTDFGFNDKEFAVMDGLAIGSDEFMTNYGKNLGSIYNRMLELGDFKTSKSLVDFLNDKELRTICKANFVSIDVFVKTFGGPKWKALAEFMKNNKIDLFTTDKAVKLNGQKLLGDKRSSSKGSLTLFNKDGSLIDMPSTDVDKFKQIWNLDNVISQQELRKKVGSEGKGKVPIQLKTNLISAPSFPEYLNQVNRQIEITLAEIEKEFNGMTKPEDMKAFVIKLFTKESASISVDPETGEETILNTEGENLDPKNLEGNAMLVYRRLSSGASINEPFIRESIIRKILSYIEKEGLTLDGNRQGTYLIPDVFGHLKDYRDSDDGKHTLLPQVAANLPGGRYPKSFATKKEAISHIEKNKGQHQDLLDKDGNINEWEIETEDGKFIVPGEMVFVNFVPGTNFHSHPLGRLHLRSVGNSSAVSSKLADRAGKDFDADGAYLLFLFKDKAGNIIVDETKKGRLNQSILAIKKDYNDKNNLQLLLNPIDTNKYDDSVIKVLDKLYPPDKSREFDRSIYWHPWALQEARTLGLDGVNMKAIATNHATTFSYLHSIRPDIKSFTAKNGKKYSSQFTIPKYSDKGELKKPIILDGIPVDKFNIYKEHHANITNLCFDNMTDPKIGRIGVNVWTSNLFEFTLINDSSLSSENYKTSKALDEAVTERIKEIAILFNRPTFKSFAQECDKFKKSNQFNSNSEIQRLAYEEVERTYNSKHPADVLALQNLLKYSSDLGVIKQVQKLTEQTPKSYEEYAASLDAVKRLKTNGLLFYDTRKFLDENQRELNPLLENAMKSLKSAENLAFRKSIETSKIAQFVVHEVKNRIAADKGSDRGIWLGTEAIKRIMNNLQAFISLNALSRNVEPGTIADRLIDEFPEYKTKFSDNKFMDYVQVEDRLDIRDIKDIKLREEKTIQVPTIFRYVAFTEEQLKEIHDDFDKLPSELKDKLYLYMIYEHGIKNATSTGTFYQFMSDKFLNEKAKIIEEEMQRWEQNDFGDLTPNQISKVLVDNINEFVKGNRGKVRFKYETRHKYDTKEIKENFSEFVGTFSLKDVQKLQKVKGKEDLVKLFEEKGAAVNDFLSALISYSVENGISIKAKTADEFIKVVQDFFSNPDNFVKVEEMNKKMLASDNITGKDTNTLEKFESGERTATTRSFPLGSFKGENLAYAEKTIPGRLVRLKGGSVYVVVSVEQLTKEVLDDPTFPERWSKKELWTPEYFKKTLGNKTVHEGSWQTTLRKIDPMELKTNRVGGVKVKNELPSEFHGKVVYASIGAGKSVLASKKEGAIDADDLLIEVLRQHKIDHDKHNFGIRGYHHIDFIWNDLRSLIEDKLHEGYTVFGSNFFFLREDLGKDLVDYAFLEKNANKLYERTVERAKVEERNPVELEYLNRKIAQENNAFVEFDKNRIYLDGKYISDYFEPKIQSSLGNISEKDVFGGTKEIPTKHGRTNELLINELSSKIKGKNADIDKLLKRVVENYPDSKVILFLDLVDPKGPAALSLSNNVEMYKDSVGKNFEKHLLHELAHLDTKERINKDKVFRNELGELFKKSKEASSNSELYGFSNIHDFAAEFISNPEFRAELNSEVISGVEKLFGYENPSVEIKKPKNQLPKTVHEALLTSDPELADYMINHLVKSFPEIEMFRDKDSFVKYCETNAKRGLTFDVKAIGHAFSNAVYIDPKKAFQSTPVHEYGHIYFDSLPDTDVSKKALRQMYSEQGLSVNEVDENIVFDIGRAGVKLAAAQLEVSKRSKLTKVLPKFWEKVKKIWSKPKFKTKDDFINHMVDTMWNREPNENDPFNHQVVRNMIVESDPNGDLTFEERLEPDGHHSLWTKEGKRLITPSGLKAILTSGNRFNEEDYIRIKLRQTQLGDRKSVTIAETKRLEAQVKFITESGNDIHNLAAAYFEQDPTISQALIGEILTKNVVDAKEVLKELVELRKFIEKKWGKNLKYYVEQTFANVKNGIAVRPDILVEVQPHKLVYLDFKTSDPSFFNADGSYNDKVTEAHGLFGKPLEFVPNTIENQRKIQFSMTKYILENQVNGTSDRNEVIGMYVVPISTRLDITQNEDGDWNYKIKDVSMKKPISVNPIHDAAIRKIQKFIDRTKDLGKNYLRLKSLFENTHTDYDLYNAGQLMDMMEQVINSTLDKITTYDVMNITKTGVARIEDTLLTISEDEGGHSYKPADIHGNNALPFEEILAASGGNLNRKKLEASVSDNVIESVERQLAGLEHEDWVENNTGHFYDPVSKKGYEAVGYKDLISDYTSPAKISEGEAIGIPIQYVDSSGNTRLITENAVVKSIHHNSKFPSKSYIIAESEYGDFIRLDGLDPHDGILREVKKWVTTSAFEKKRMQFSLDSVEEAKKYPYQPTMGYREVFIRGRHVAPEKNVESSRGAMRNFTKYLRIIKDFKTLNDFVQVMNAEPERILKIYRDIQFIKEDFIEPFRNLVVESLHAKMLAERIQAENKEGQRAYPLITSLVGEWMINPGDKILDRLFGQIIKHSSWRMLNTLPNYFVAQNITIDHMTHSLYKENYHMSLMSEKLAEWNQKLNSDPMFRMSDIISIRNGSWYLKHPSTIDGAGLDFEFASFIYEKWSEYEGVTHDVTKPIKIPSQSATVGELNDRYASLKLGPLLTRRIRNASMPEPWDNEVVTLRNQSKRLIDWKKHFISQLTTEKQFDEIYGTGARQLISLNNRNLLLSDGILNNLRYEARKEYRKSDVEQLNLNFGKARETAIPSDKVVRDFEEGFKKLIHAFAHEESNAVVDFLAKKIQKIEEQKNSTYQATSSYIMNMMRIIGYNKMDIPGDNLKVLDPFIRFTNRTFSHAVLGLNIPVQLGNYVAGDSTTLLSMPELLLKGYGEAIKNPRNVTKAWNLMNRFKVLNLSHSLKLADASRLRQWIDDKEYWFLDKTEKAIAMKIFLGLTGSQLDAYDSNGNLLPGREKDEITLEQIKNVVDVIALTQGPYQTSSKPPALYSTAGNLVSLFKVWMLSRKHDMFSRPYLDKRNIERAGYISRETIGLLAIANFNAKSASERKRLIEEADKKEFKGYFNYETWLEHKMRKAKHDQEGKGNDKIPYDKKSLENISKAMIALAYTALILYITQKHDEEDPYGEKLSEDYWFRTILLGPVTTFTFLDPQKILDPSKMKASDYLPQIRVWSAMVQASSDFINFVEEKYKRAYTDPNYRNPKLYYQKDSNTRMGEEGESRIPEDIFNLMEMGTTLKQIAIARHQYEVEDKFPYVKKRESLVQKEEAEKRDKSIKLLKEKAYQRLTPEQLEKRAKFDLKKDSLINAAKSKQFNEKFKENTPKFEEIKKELNEKGNLTLRKNQARINALQKKK